MKISAINLLVATTIVLLTLVLLALLDFSFGIVFYFTALGQILLVFTVYKILKDTYTTDKTFDDFYEDNPIKNNIP